MTKHVLGNGQSSTVGGGQWNGDSLAFTGTSGATGVDPIVTFTGPNTLAGVTDSGTAATPGFGTINLTSGAGLVIDALSVSQATLAISEHPGTTVTFDGTSRIANNSTLTATGLSGAGTYAINGSMSIGGDSTVNMDYVAVTGTGTITLAAPAALLRVGSVGAGETVVLNGGMLSLTNGMSFLGTITDATPAVSRIGSAASVDIYNALSAVDGTFNRTTGVLQLFNASGAIVTNLTFAGTGKLYVTPTTGLSTNYLAVTSHPTAGMLPIITS